MKYKFKVKPLDFSTGTKEVIVLHKEDADEMNISPMDRVKISKDGGKEEIAIVDLTVKNLSPGTMGSFYGLTKQLDLEEGDEVYLNPIEKPDSTDYIKKKLEGKELSEEETRSIIEDVMEDRLSDIEMTSYVTSLYIRGMTEQETVDFTNAIIDSGDTLDFKKRVVVDKHCIGGVPGNRTTMLIVPIVAAAGLTIPKTSSRSITSPAGTADSMEVLAPVSHNLDEIKEIVEKTNGCMVWGGAINLAAADDKLIRVRHPLSIDPKGVLLGSILAKKKAAGATNVLIDIPIGKGAKVSTKEKAEDLSEDFMRLGTKLNMEVKCIVTPGYDPVGAAIGPALEAKEVLRILKGEDVSRDLKDKALQMAGILLETGGKAEEGEGYRKAAEILKSGKAEEKMREIIEAQNGDPEIQPEDIEIGKHSKELYAEETGRIQYIHTSKIAEIAKLAGAPKEKGSGIYLEVEKGDRIEEGDKLMTIYSESERKLESALDYYKENHPVEMHKVVLEEYSTEEKPIVHELK